MTRLTVVTAGLSQPSSTRLLADRLASAARNALSEHGIDTSVDVIEIRDHAKDLTNAVLTRVVSPGLQAAIDSVSSADGLVVVTPIFTASYSGLFKMFFDTLDTDTLAGKPVLIGATGGTERHSLALEHALRPLFAYLRALVVPTAVYAASSDWGSRNGDRHALTERIERAGRELASLVASQGVRERTDPFDNPTPFEKLLGLSG